MHELSLADALIDKITRLVPSQDLLHVRSVRVRIGTMSGVERDTFSSAYAAIVSGTPLRDSSLAIEVIPFTVACRSCGTTTSNEAGVCLCGTCGGTDTYVRSGTELDMISIELTESTRPVDPVKNTRANTSCVS
jgi:hydrogenase nickel incorporation protein HypA/HybF